MNALCAHVIRKMKKMLKQISSREFFSSSGNKSNFTNNHHPEGGSLLLGKTIQVEGKRFRLVEVLSSSGASAVVYKAKFEAPTTALSSSSSVAFPFVFSLVFSLFFWVVLAAILARVLVAPVSFFGSCFSRVVCLFRSLFSLLVRLFAPLWVFGGNSNYSLTSSLN